MARHRMPSEEVAVARIRFDAVVLLLLWLCTLTTGSARAQEPGWTDDPLLPRVTPIKATHFTELRTRINELLTGCGGTAFVFTDATLKAGETPVRAVHVIELRAGHGPRLRCLRRHPPDLVRSVAGTGPQ